MGFELRTLVVIATDCIGSCKSNYHDDQIKEIEKLLGSEEFQSSEHRDILTNTLDTLREAQEVNGATLLMC